MGVLLWNRETEALVSDGEFRVAAVVRVAGKKRAVAKVFAVRQAELAFAAGPGQPRNAHTRADFVTPGIFPPFDDGADDFVAWHKRQFWFG